MMLVIPGNEDASQNGNPTWQPDVIRNARLQSANETGKSIAVIYKGKEQ